MTQALKPTPSKIITLGWSDHSWNRRILVVDDEKEIANSYVQILCPADSQPNVTRSSRTALSTPSSTHQDSFEVSVCYSASEALKKVQKAMDHQRPFAMGFFDVRLGEKMDGIELFKAIHHLDPQMHAVFVTAYQDRSVDAINQFLGPEIADRWDYLNKPFSEGEILQKARNAVAIWNLRKEKEVRDALMEELHQKICAADRLNSVAMVSRGVAHEFGNILMQISGQAELYRDGSPENMQRALDNILAATDVATNILARFRDLENPSQAKIKKEIIWAHQPLDLALQFMEFQLRQSQTQIHRIKTDQVPIYGCGTSLVQVFINLTINAIHAMGRGGRIDYSVTNINNQWAEIKVRDYGPGIPPHIIDRITEPFFTTKGNEGTGLGLAITKEIIEFDHEGQLQIRNNSQKGAEFVIRIPIHQATPQSTKE